MIYELINRLKNIIIRSKVTTEQLDDGYAYSININSFNQTTISEALYPYGYAASPPIGSLALTFFISNQPENKISIPYNPTTKFKGLKSGEVIIGNQIKNIFIKFNNDGTIDIVSDFDVNIKGNLNVSGNINCDNEIIDGSGTSISAIKSAYNPHDHLESGGGTTGPPNPTI